MSGLYSRRKGMRCEYEIRDMFRAWGYTCHRVPASGAAQGFKADLEVKHPFLGTIKVEVKARKDEFKLLYKEFTNPQTMRLEQGEFFCTHDDPLQADRVVFIPLRSTEKRFQKVVNRYFHNCDILVIKDDRKQPIFIRKLNGDIKVQG